jgi:hypothetical protein
MGAKSGIKWNGVAQIQTQDTIETIGSDVQIILRDPRTEQEWVTSSTDYINALVSLGVINTGGAGYWDTSGNDIFNNNSGNVGIGINTPAYRLDVTDDSQAFAPYLQVGIDDGEPYCFIGNREGGTNVAYAEFSASDFNFISKAGDDIMSIEGRPEHITFSNAGGVIMHFDSATNNVGIGTETPTSLLTVDGDIEVLGISNGIIIQSPDATRWKLSISNLGVPVVTLA